MSQKKNTIDLIAFGIAMSAGACVTGTVTQDTGFDEHMPLVVQDIYEWVKLVFAVNHPIFHLPHCITYGKYCLILDNMASITCSPELRNLNPKKDITVSDLVTSLNQVDPMYRFLLDNYLVMLVMNTSKEISSLRVMPTSARISHWTDEYRILALDGGSHRTIIRRVKFTGVHTNDQREMIMRWRASESTLLSRTSCLMLCDVSMPVRMIPGVENTDVIRTYAEHVDMEQLCPD